MYPPYKVHLIVMTLDPKHLIESGGILIVSLIIVAESGILIGFFLPGDSLLFAAGLAASNGDVSLPLLVICVVAAAILGDNVGYSIGKKMGSTLFTKDDGIIFRKEYIETASKFYEKHGGKTIIVARFTPIVRTFAPVVAGATNMSRERFFLFNVVGGITWGAGIPLLGYFVGNKIPGIDRYMEVVILTVVLLSIAVSIGHILKDEKARTQLKEKAKHHAKRVLRRK